MILDKFRVQARIHVYKRTQVDEDTEQPFTHWALLIDYFVPGNLELVEKSELYDLMDDGEGYQKVIHRSFSRFWDMSEQGAELITLYDGEHKWVENKWNSVEDFGKMYTEMKHWYNSVTEDTALFVAELLHHLNIVQCMPPLSAQKGVISNAVVLSRTYFSHLVFKNMKTYIMGNKGFYLRIAKTLMSECERGFTQMFQELGEDFLAQLSKTIADEIANRLVAEEIDFLTPMYLLRIASTTIASTLSRFSVGAAISAEISGIPAEVDQNAGNAKKGKPKTKKQNKVHKFGSNFMDTKGKEGHHKPVEQEEEANMEEQEEDEIPAEVDVEEFKKDKLKTKKKNKVQKFGAGFMEKKGKEGQHKSVEQEEEDEELEAPEEQEEPAEVEVEGKPKTRKKNKVQKFGSGFMEKKVKDGQPEQAEEQEAEAEAEAPEEQEEPVEDIKKDKPKTKKQNKVQKFGAGFMEKKGGKGQPEQPVEQEEEDEELEAPEEQEEPTEVEVEDVKKDKPKTKKQNKVQKFGSGFMEKKGKEGQHKSVEQEEEAQEEQEEPAEVEVEDVKKDKPKTKKQNKVQKFGSGFMEKKVKEEQQEPVEQEEEAATKQPEAQKKQPSMKEKLIAQRKQEKEAAEEAERAERAEKARKAEEAAKAEKAKLAEKLEGEEENKFPTQAQLSKFAQVTSSVRFHDDDLIQMSTEVFAVLTKMLLDKKYGTEFTGKFNDEELKTLVEGVLPWFDTAAKLGIPWVTYVKEIWNPFSIRY